MPQFYNEGKHSFVNTQKHTGLRSQFLATTLNRCSKTVP